MLFVISMQFAGEGLICGRGFGKFTLRLVWPQTDLGPERPDHGVQNQNSQPRGKHATGNSLPRPRPDHLLHIQRDLCQQEGVLKRGWLVSSLRALMFFKTCYQIFKSHVKMS